MLAAGRTKTAGAILSLAGCGENSPANIPASATANSDSNMIINILTSNTPAETVRYEETVPNSTVPNPSEDNTDLSDAVLEADMLAKELVQTTNMWLVDNNTYGSYAAKGSFTILNLKSKGLVGEGGLTKQAELFENLLMKRWLTIIPTIPKCKPRFGSKTAMRMLVWL